MRGSAEESAGDTRHDDEGSRRREKAQEEQKKNPAKKIEGVGEEAFWSGNGVGGASVVNTYKEGLSALNGGKQVRFEGAGGPTNFNKWNNSQGGYIIVKYTATGDEQQISRLSEQTVASIIQAGGGG